MAEVSYVADAKGRNNPHLRVPYASAFALFNVSWAAGTLIGPLWAGFVREKAGWGTMAWSLGLLSVLSAIPAAIWTGGLITQKQKNLEKREARMNDTRQIV